MSKMIERVKQMFEASIETNIAAADSMSLNVVEAGQRLIQCLLSEGRIYVCGNGGSAANGLHFVASMLNQFEVERPPMPVLMLGTDFASLTALMGEGQAELAFARQLQALGQEGDVLLVLTTTGNANNILNVVTEAHERGMDVIALSGRDGGILANHLGPEDIELRVPGNSSVRIRETHLFLLHCFCDLIDQSLFGSLSV